MERHVYPFGSAFVVAVLATALVFAVKAVVPGVEESAEEAFGHAWFYMGIFALVVFFVAGLMPLRFARSEGGLAAQIGIATVASGAIILAVSAYLGAAE